MPIRHLTGRPRGASEGLSPEADGLVVLLRVQSVAALQARRLSVGATAPIAEGDSRPCSSIPRIVACPVVVVPLGILQLLLKKLLAHCEDLNVLFLHFAPLEKHCRHSAGAVRVDPPECTPVSRLDLLLVRESARVEESLTLCAVACWHEAWAQDCSRLLSERLSPNQALSPVECNGSLGGKSLGHSGCAGLGPGVCCSRDGLWEDVGGSWHNGGRSGGHEGSGGINGPQVGRGGGGWGNCEAVRLLPGRGGGRLLDHLGLKGLRPQSVARGGGRDGRHGRGPWRDTEVLSACSGCHQRHLRLKCGRGEGLQHRGFHGCHLASFSDN
mmetsp:Transcript_8903/g.17384  ORF Transcript_8903/g.17384 Transcript_8903/m.17384 type:complete len:327 (+) Transcript_8903:66-1046(+)